MDSGNSQKTPVVRSLSLFAERKVSDAIQVLGKALPCSVVAVVSSGVVTVKFEVASPFTLPNVTVPMLGPEYVRYPTQAGNKGFVISADASLAGISGLGAGTSSLTAPANLSALAFVPIGSKSWSATDDTDAVVIYGPNGAVVRTTDKTVAVTVSPTGVSVKVPLTKTLNIRKLPTAAAGLLPGDLWLDASAGNVVKAIPG